MARTRSLIKIFDQNPHLHTRGWFTELQERLKRSHTQLILPGHLRTHDFDELACENCIQLVRIQVEYISRFEPPRFQISPVKRQQ